MRCRSPFESVGFPRGFLDRRLSATRPTCGFSHTHTVRALRTPETTNPMDDETDRCGATTRDGDPCKRPAGWGTDHQGEGRCKQHGGASDGAPPGEDNGSYDHGGFAEALPEDTDDIAAITEAFRDAVDVDSLDPVWVHLAAEAFARYRRSEDSRHLAECRRCLENAGDGEETVELGDIEVVADFT